MPGPAPAPTPDSCRRLIGWCVTALAVGLSACSSTKNPLPSPFVGNAVDHPVSCAELQAGQIVDKAIQLDGGIPNCGADGLRCPLSGVTKATASGVCGSKMVVASCAQNRWVLACEAPPDGSAPLEAGPDAAKADSGDAAADATTDAGSAATDANAD